MEPERNGQYFENHISNRILLTESVCVLIQISLKYACCFLRGIGHVCSLCFWFLGSSFRVRCLHQSSGYQTDIALYYKLELVHGYFTSHVCKALSKRTITVRGRYICLAENETRTQCAYHVYEAKLLAPYSNDVNSSRWLNLRAVGEVCVITCP